MQGIKACGAPAQYGIWKALRKLGLQTHLREPLQEFQVQAHSLQEHNRNLFIPKNHLEGRSSSKEQPVQCTQIFPVDEI
jgi:hypothetical protein